MHRTLFEQLALLTTEAINPATAEVDTATALGIAQLLHAEDCSVPVAVGAVLPEIAAGITLVANAFAAGGRLIYVGAGTSGRLGILDASEMPPTYGTNPDMVQGVIAGGRDAVFRSVEGAEDSDADGAAAVDALQVSALDVVCGISASGRTPFVVGAIRKARELGAQCIMVSTNGVDVVRDLCPGAHVYICPVVGPEPIAGSTRMKSGTAQKMVLNMLSTGAMVRNGKTYGNVMVDLRLSNQKLHERARKIVMSIAGVSYEVASSLLEQAEGSVKVALVMAKHHCTPDQAKQQLEKAGGFVRPAMESPLTA